MYAATLFALAFFVYANSLRNDFNFDDVTLIKNNPHVRLTNLPRLLASNYWANTPYEKGVLLYRPLPMATFALDRALWGENPGGFHLTNVLINAVNAGLVLLLLAALFEERVSLAALSSCALLFALHPVHTEAVNMVVGRTELLAAMFGLLTFLCYVRRRSVSAFVLFFMALLCKESAITIPIVIILYEWLFQERFARWRCAAFGGVAVVYLAIRFSVLGGFSSVHQSGMFEEQGVLARALMVIKGLGYYLKLLVVPYPLTPDYSDVPLSASVLAPSVLVSFGVIVVLLLVAWGARKRAAAVTFGILWFFITILPVSNVISIGAFLGERFLYLPSLSLSLAAAGAWHCISGREAQQAWLAACFAVCAVLGALTFSRNFDWKDAGTLWAKVLAHQPNNPRALYHMAVRYEEQKDYEKALEAYERSIRHYPDHNWQPDSRSIAGVREAISRVAYNLAVRSYKAEDFETALGYCGLALENNSRHAEAYVVKGNIWVQKGDPNQAAQMYQQALKANPEQFEAKENLKRITTLQ